MVTTWAVVIRPKFFIESEKGLFCETLYSSAISLKCSRQSLAKTVSRRAFSLVSPPKATTWQSQTPRTMPAFQKNGQRSRVSSTARRNTSSLNSKLAINRFYFSKPLSAKKPYTREGSAVDPSFLRCNRPISMHFPHGTFPGASKLYA